MGTGDRVEPVAAVMPSVDSGRSSETTRATARPPRLCSTPHSQ